MYNKIEATCDLKNKNWNISQGEFHPGGCFVTIKFSETNGVDELEFGLNFYIDNGLVSSESYPKERMKVASLLEKYQVEPSVDLQLGKSHRIHLWAKINGETIERNITIENVTIPRPYPSWKLKNGEWVPPVPKPTEKSIWNWNESKQKWESLDFQYMPGTGGSATEV